LTAAAALRLYAKFRRQFFSAFNRSMFEAFELQSANASSTAAVPQLK
jgi:hypothetical protein